MRVYQRTYTVEIQHKSNTLIAIMLTRKYNTGMHYDMHGLTLLWLFLYRWMVKSYAGDPK